MKQLACIALTILVPVVVTSPELQAQEETSEEFESKLGYQTGTVSIRSGLATIHLPQSFRFIGPEGSRRLLTEAWRNPKEAADGVLGMLIPTSTSPLSPEGWGIVITYDEDGYVDEKGRSEERRVGK